MQSVMGSRSDIINRAHSDANAWELFVGDAAGSVSRWCTQKLENLLSVDKTALILEGSIL